MSREREKQRKKREELARQLGVGRAGVDDRKDLAQRERVTRPVVQLVARKSTRGLLRRLIEKFFANRDAPLVLALWLVDANGARLVDAHVLDGARRELAKLTYHRPAHFVVAVLPAASTAEATAVVAAVATARVTLEGIDVASDALASSAWEAPRRVRVDGLPAPIAGAAMSMRGVGRSELRHDFPLESCVATLVIEL